MKFKELDDILKLKLKKVCRVNKSLNGWLPSSEDFVVIKEGKVEAIFSKNLEINFEGNNIISVNRF